MHGNTTDPELLVLQDEAVHFAAVLPTVKTWCRKWCAITLVIESEVVAYVGKRARMAWASVLAQQFAFVCTGNCAWYTRTSLHNMASRFCALATVPAYVTRGHPPCILH